MQVRSVYTIQEYSVSMCTSVRSVNAVTDTAGKRLYRHSAHTAFLEHIRSCERAYMYAAVYATVVAEFTKTRCKQYKHNY